jgi:hypothetical protein
MSSRVYFRGNRSPFSVGFFTLAIVLNKFYVDWRDVASLNALKSFETDDECRFTSRKKEAKEMHIGG